MMRRALLVLAAAAVVISSCTTAATPTSTLAPEDTSAPTTAAEPPIDPTATIESVPTVEPIEVDSETLNILEAEDIPFADPIDLARRLSGFTGEIPQANDSPTLEVGERAVFIAGDQDTKEQFEVPATLQYVTDHAYFWIQDEISFDPDDLERLAVQFENRIYPSTREFFGSEDSPGIDGDPHLYILYAGGLGFNVAGYFSFADTIHPTIRDDSNGHEMFYLNAGNLELDEDFTAQVLTHEYQHAIHWNVDPDEDIWVNEGLSELAVHVAGQATARNHPLYTEDPDRSLNDWDPDDSGPNYGAASLFMVYFLDRYGDELTQSFINHQANGLKSIDIVLEEDGALDPLTGELFSADRTVLDWAIANLLNDKSVADGRFSYSGFSELRKTRQTETVQDCPDGELNERDAQPYGVDYVRIICDGQFTLEFDGAEETQVLPVDPFSGDYAFWSNKGDSRSMRLTRAFDLSDVNGPISLVIQTWYDIERDWDYVFVEVSDDAGQTWEIIRTPSGTDTNPNGNSYGWALTGETRGSEWIEETVDLSSYAGKEILVRLEYLTDGAVNGEGMLIDDISIPEIGYFTDFESDDGGWEAEGWVRIKNVLPQTFQLAWISLEDETTVEYIPVGVNNTARVPIEISEDGAGVLVIVPTTRFTRQPATYNFSIVTP